ncbi:MAG: MarR family transcriptional regulator [Burkholderiaceae bacterium]|nr:MarR family transcriptional regulator [Microbacteriaceae bacterium]
MNESTVAVAEALDNAVGAILHWSTRSTVRRALCDSALPPLSPTDAWLLQRVGDAGASRMSELADAQGVDKSTMTAAVQRLEGKLVVERRADPRDRRVVLVSITELGREVLDGNRAIALGVFSDLVEDWSPAEHSDIVRLLDKFVARLESTSLESGSVARAPA